MFAKQVLDTAAQLGLRWWERIALILAISILRVLGKGVWNAIRVIEWNVETAPEVISDGGQPGDHKIPAQPTSGPPGGGTEGGMG